MLTARILKDSAEIVRRTFDFTKWLDNGEALTNLNLLPTVIEGGFGVGPPPISLPDDTIPPVLSFNLINGNTAAQILYQLGTPGLTYKCTFTVFGTTSSRKKQVDVFVTVRPTL